MAIDVFTTVLVPATATPPAGAYDLTDLATIKDELKITDTTQDNFLQRGITQISTAISNYCNRVFLVETVQDVLYPNRDAYPYQVPGGVAPLQLSRWPLLGAPGPAAPVNLTTSSLTSSGAVLAFGNASTVPAGAPAVGTNIPTGAVVQAVASTGPIATSAISSGGGGGGYAPGDTGSVTAGTGDADYVVNSVAGGVVTGYSLTAPGTAYANSQGNATATGGAQPGSGTGLKIDITGIAVTASLVTLSAPISGPVPSGASVTFGLTVTVVDPPGTTTQLAFGTDYVIDAKTGWLTRLNKYTSYPSLWDVVMTTVTYQAGYSPIPADLVDAALRVLTMRFTGRGRDPLLRSDDQPGEGTQNYWVGSLPGVKGPFPEEIAALLDFYRVPATA